MSWLLINADNSIANGPMDDEPTPADGQKAVVVCLGYPTTCTWDAAAGGFVDKVPVPPTQCAALIALLVTKGVLTNADAAGLPQ